VHVFYIYETKASNIEHEPSHYGPRMLIVFTSLVLKDAVHFITCHVCVVTVFLTVCY